MEQRILLAFAGKMYTGKDTAANIWVKRYKQYFSDLLDKPQNGSGPLIRDYQRLAFADGIKHICKCLFDLSDEDLNTPEGKKKHLLLYGKTVRELLQGVGEGLRQSVSPNIWVFNTVQKIDKIMQFTECNILVTDVRYPNEVAALKSRGFTMVKMMRNTGVEDNHPSERDLNDNLFDYIIDNNGTIEDLEKKLLMIPAYTPALC